MFWKTDLGKILLQIFVPILGGIAVVLPIVIILIRLETQPVQSRRVEVVSKRTKAAYYHSTGGGVYKKSTPDGYITFEFSDGFEKEFYVKSAEIYNVLQEGDTGILSYKQVKDGTGIMEKRFISFEKDS